MKSKNLFLVLFCLCILQTYSQWLPLRGPGGGSVHENSFVVKENQGGNPDIYCSAGNNIFISSDNGDTWSETEAIGLPIPTMNGAIKLAIFNENLYAGINSFSQTDGGIYVSKDKGKTWSAVNTGLPSMYLIVKDFAIIGNKLFAGFAYNGGVYMTSDEGKNWTAVNIGLTNKSVNCLKTVGNTLYAGTTNGIYKTDNEGQMWTVASDGIPQNSSISCITSNKNGVFAAVSDYYVYFSDNNGTTWSQVKNGLPLTPNGIVIALTNKDDNIYAGMAGGGIHYTTDNGQNWTSLNDNVLKNDHIWNIQALLYYNNIFLAGSDRGGIYKSIDNGQNWVKCNKGFNATNVTALALKDNFLFAGTSGLGIFIYDKSTQQWNTGTTYEQIYATKINSIAVDGNTIIAAEVGKIYLTHDDGQTWENANLNYNQVSKIFIDGSSIYIATSGEGIYKSTDKGKNWATINNGLTNLNVRDIFALNNEIYAGTDNGMFYSSNGGANFTPINNGINDLYIKTVFKANNVLYCSSGGSPTGGFFISKDNGANWVAVNTNSGLKDFNVTAYVSTGNTIIIGTAGLTDNGVYFSIDQGTTWTNINYNLRHKLIRSLAIDENTLYAGTNEGGVWILPLSSVSIMNKSNFKSSINVYPNPASKFIIINSPDNFKVLHYNINDITGKSILNGIISSENISVDISMLPKGIYILKIETFNFKLIKQ